MGLIRRAGCLAGRRPAVGLGGVARHHGRCPRAAQGEGLGPGGLGPLAPGRPGPAIRGSLGASRGVGACTARGFSDDAPHGARRDAFWVLSGARNRRWGGGPGGAPRRKGGGVASRLWVPDGDPQRVRVLGQRGCGSPMGNRRLSHIGRQNHVETAGVPAVGEGRCRWGRPCPQSRVPAFCESSLKLVVCVWEGLTFSPSQMGCEIYRSQMERWSVDPELKKCCPYQIRGPCFIHAYN